MNEADNEMSIESANRKILSWMEFQQQDDFADSSLRRFDMSEKKTKFLCASASEWMRIWAWSISYNKVFSSSERIKS